MVEDRFTMSTKYRLPAQLHWAKTHEARTISATAKLLVNETNVRISKGFYRAASMQGVFSHVRNVHLSLSRLCLSVRLSNA